MATPTIAKMATAIIISSRLHARAFLPAGERLIDIVLDAVPGDVGGDAACASERAGFPVQRNRELAHIRRVAFGADRSRAVRNGNVAGVGDALISRGALRVVNVGESRLNEAVGKDLIPVVKPDGLQLREH